MEIKEKRQLSKDELIDRYKKKETKPVRTEYVYYDSFGNPVDYEKAKTFSVQRFDELDQMISESYGVIDKDDSIKKSR